MTIARFIGTGAYWAWIATEILVLLLTRTRHSTGNVRDRGSLHILWPVIFTSITVGSWYGGTHPHDIFAGARWSQEVALALFLTGLLIRWTAIATLGRSFSANVAIHATQTVKKTGIFRFVRHPSYTGLVIIFAAIGLYTRNWVGCAIVFVPAVAALLYRIQVEEAALTDAFGQEYIDYSRATKRLIPGVF